MAETMNVEQAKVILAADMRHAKDMERNLTRREGAVDWHDRAAALRLALARLAAMDAVAAALKPFVEAVQNGIALDLRMRRMHGDAWHADDLDMTLPFDQCRALLAAYAQLGGPTDA